MKIDRHKIEKVTHEHLREFNRADDEEIHEYVETIIYIAKQCGYTENDLWDENDNFTELLKAIDKILYNTAIEMGVYDMLN